MTPTETPTQTRRVQDTDHESWAVGWLTLGLLFGLLGAFIGVFLVLRSTRWSTRWKAVALILPVVVGGMARLAPEDGPASMFAWPFWLVTLAIAVAAAYVLDAAAARGSMQRRPGRLAGLVAAAVLVALASVPLSRLHSIGSYDYHDEIVAAARSAEAAGESYGVVTESFLDQGDAGTVERTERLAGPGNARFVTIFEELEDEHGGLETSTLSSKDRGTCYVFPVVSSRREGVESVTHLARQCVGPSEAGSALSISDR
ncbi:hypothetical protein [Aeromicrobium sp. NPDC092404]|uniref:hypothetical protein n=1 Tax=Aeromicrobium sp. NPDC092404 TaxID=3154976 RepID=UPI003440CB2B